MTDYRDIFKSRGTVSLSSYYNDKHQQNGVPFSGSNALPPGIESDRFLLAYKEQQARYIPPIDHRNPETFCQYGSAKKYYEDSFDRILETYPYDGSRAEKIEWSLSSSVIDLYIFEHEYPKSKGFLKLTNLDHAHNVSNYGVTRNATYVTFSGGPHENTIFNPSLNRESNLKIDGTKGNTIEFWLKKSSTSFYKEGLREVVFDATTSKFSTAATDFGRIKIEIENPASDSQSPFLFTYMSGNATGADSLRIGSSNITKATTADSKWHHYAISAVTSGSTTQIKLYKDGTLDSTTSHNEAIGSVDRPITGSIGALCSEDLSAINVTGALRASIDEVRYWKKERTAKEIGRNWYRPVNGGTDLDHSNADLGLYFKFNEGTTGEDREDKVVLDYSGRVNNGTIVNYKSDCRDSRSGIDLSENLPQSDYVEPADPIVIPASPSVETKRQEFVEIGSNYDSANNNSLVNSIPQFMRDQDQDLLPELLQILASALDDLFLKIMFLPRMKEYQDKDLFSSRTKTRNLSVDSFFFGCDTDEDFKTAGSKTKPWISDTLQHYGFLVPDIFDNAEMYEIFNQASDVKNFDYKLGEVKNTILSNIHKNLTHIYNTKGTENSFRNMMRCFGVDTDLIKFNVYTENESRTILNDVSFETVKQKSLDFSEPLNTGATLYLTSSATGDALGHITGSHIPCAYTLESNIIAPSKNLDPDIRQASLFGLSDNFQVFSVRPQSAEKHAYFLLTSSQGLFTEVTSSTYANVYDDEHWHLSVRVSKDQDLDNNILPVSASDSYKVEFTGYNYDLDIQQSSFSVSSSISKANYDSFNSSNKYAYLGAERANLVGSILNRSNVKSLGAAMWLDRLTDEELQVHAQNSSYFGRKNPFEIIKEDSGQNLTAADSLVFRWQFENLTSSNPSGQISVEDLSSGSAGKVSDATMGTIVGYKYPALGVNFGNISGTISQEFMPFVKITPMGNRHTSTAVDIVDSEVERFTASSKPVVKKFIFEKSMYQIISERALDFFAGISGYNTLIGATVNKYRHEYKSLNTLRERFFSRVQNTIDLDKFVEYYRWIDSSLSKALTQLMPASANVTDKLRNTVESHILERNKYQHPAPTIEFKANEDTHSIFGINELDYNWRLGHAPLRNTENSNCVWNQERRELDDVLKTQPNNVETLRISAATNFVSFGDNALFTPYTDFTFGGNYFAKPRGVIWSFYVKVDDTSIDNILVEKDDEFTIKALTGGHLFVRFGKSSNNLTIQKNSAFTQGQWHHVLIHEQKHDGTKFSENALIAYIDGVIVTSFDTKEENGTYLGIIQGDGAHAAYDDTDEDLIIMKGKLRMVDLVYAVNGSSLEAEKFTNKQTNIGFFRKVDTNTGTPLRVDYMSLLISGSTLPLLKSDGSLDTEDKMLAYWPLSNSTYNPLTGSYYSDGANRVLDNLGSLHGASSAAGTANLELDSPYLPQSTLIVQKSSALRRVVTTEVSGSTYARRALVKPYKLGIDSQQILVQRDISDEFYKSINEERDIVVNSADLIRERDGCLDEDTITNTRKHEFDTTVSFGGELFDSKHTLPFNFLSSSTVSDLPNFRSNIEVTDISTIDRSVLQGPFSHQHEGLMPHQAVEWTKTTERPEAYSISYNTNALTMSVVDTSTPKSQLRRSTGVSTPYVVRNIKDNTGSKILGNYQKDYQIVQAHGRETNNRALANHGEALIEDIQSTYISGVVDFTKQSSSASDHVFVSRFSAPGSPESMTAFGMDRESGELSVYNTLNYRNSLVRGVNNKLLAEQSDQFGYRSGSTTQGSVHKTNRNTRKTLSSIMSNKLVPLNSKALDFNNSDYVIASDSDDFSFTDGSGNDKGFTFSFWVNPSELTTAKYMIAKFYKTTLASEPEYYVYLNAQKITVTLFKTSAGNSITRTTQFDVVKEPDRWYHVVVTYSGNEAASGINIYVNKRKITSFSDSSGGSYTGMANQDAGVYLGSILSTRGDLNFDGKMADVTIFKHAAGQQLTHQQVIELYNDGKVMDVTKHSKYSDVVAWYKMGDDLDTTRKLFDYVGGNTANINFEPSNDSFAPQIVECSLGSDMVQSSITTDESFFSTTSKFDNAFQTFTIPQNDFGYSWIRNNSSGSLDQFLYNNDGFSYTHSFNNSSSLAGENALKLSHDSPFRLHRIEQSLKDDSCLRIKQTGESVLSASVPSKLTSSATTLFNFDNGSTDGSDSSFGFAFNLRAENLRYPGAGIFSIGSNYIDVEILTDNLSETVDQDYLVLRTSNGNGGNLDDTRYTVPITLLSSSWHNFVIYYKGDEATADRITAWQDGSQVSPDNVTVSSNGSPSELPTGSGAQTVRIGEPLSTVGIGDVDLYDFMVISGSISDSEAKEFNEYAAQTYRLREGTFEKISREIEVDSKANTLSIVQGAGSSTSFNTSYDKDLDQLSFYSKIHHYWIFSGSYPLASPATIEEHSPVVGTEALYEAQIYSTVSGSTSIPIKTFFAQDVSASYKRNDTFTDALPHYYWSSWNQLRVADHPLARNQRKNNTYSMAGKFMPPSANFPKPLQAGQGYNFDYTPSLYKSVNEAQRDRHAIGQSEFRSHVIAPITNKLNPAVINFLSNGSIVTQNRASQFRNARISIIGRGPNPNSEGRFFNPLELGISSETQVDAESFWASEVVPFEFRASDLSIGSDTPIATVKTTYQNDVDFFNRFSNTSGIGTSLGIDIERQNSGRMLPRLYGDLEGNHQFVSLVKKIKQEYGRQLQVSFVETLYPPAKREFLAGTRARLDFSHPWNSERNNRAVSLTGSVTIEEPDTMFGYYLFPKQVNKSVLQDGKTNSMGIDGKYTSLTDPSVVNIQASSWPLDASNAFEGGTAPRNIGVSYFTDTRAVAPLGSDGSGELQNEYGTFAMGIDPTYITAPPAMTYNRRVLQANSSQTAVHLAGQAQWLAAEQIGSYPYTDSHGENIQEIRAISKDYSIVSEFRMSDFIEPVLDSNGLFADIGKDGSKEQFLTLTGSRLDTRRERNNETVFQEYSTSDILQHFKLVKGNSNDDLSPMRLTLRCDAAIKFVPYEGFYPAERVLQIGRVFSNKYLSNVDGVLTANSTAFNGSDFDNRLAVLDSKKRANLQQSIKSLFSPGVLLNSIKSGMAVDYPIFERDHGDMTGSFSADNPAGLIGFFGSPITGSGPYKQSHVTFDKADPVTSSAGVTGSFFHLNSDSGIPRLTGSVSHRVTFEEMLDPARLEGVLIYDNEPHPSASLAYGNHFWEAAVDRPFVFGSLNRERTSELLGVDVQESDNLNRTMLPYRMAVNNFCAEVTNIFNDDGLVTFEATAPSKAFFQKDTDYKMRIMLQNRDVMMYDRHSAFGPPVDEGDLSFAKLQEVSYDTDAQVASVSLEFNPNGYSSPTAATAGTLPGFSIITSLGGNTSHFTKTINIRYYNSVSALGSLSFTSDNYNTFNASSADETVNRYINVNGRTIQQLRDDTYDELVAANAAGLDIQVFKYTYYDSYIGLSRYKIHILQEVGGDQYNTTVAHLNSAGSTNKFYGNIGYADPSGPFGTNTFDASNTSAAEFTGGADAVSGATRIQRTSETVRAGHGYLPYVPPFLDKGTRPYVDVTFRPSDDTGGSKEYSLDEIVENLQYEYTNLSSSPLVATTDLNNSGSTNFTNAMNLSASLDLNSYSIYESDVESGTRDDRDAAKRWVIQAKWQTPVMDFTNATASVINLGTSTTEQVTSSYWKERNQRDYYFKDAIVTSSASYLTSSRGMWHQSGDYEDSRKGYYLSISDIQGAPSLARKVNFYGNQNASIVKQAGKLRQESFQFSEAVVAIPFYLDAGVQRFLDIKEEYHLDAIELNRNLDRQPRDEQYESYFNNPGNNPVESVAFQLRMMEKFVFPPRFDLPRYSKLPPLPPVPLAFVFQFNGSLDKQDLANIWQNVMPASKGSGAQARYSYGILDNERLENLKIDTKYSSIFLDSANNVPFVEGGLDNFLDNHVRWLVFKVKQRANYSLESVKEQSLTLNKAGGKLLDSSYSPKNTEFEDKLKETSYNWPYDYFSIVELIKVRAKTDFKKKT